MALKMVTVYGSDNCGYCLKATAHLARRGLAYDYRNVSKDPAAAQEMQERLPDATTVPQVFIGTEHIGGYDDLVALPEAELINKVKAL